MASFSLPTTVACSFLQKGKGEGRGEGQQRHECVCETGQTLRTGLGGMNVQTFKSDQVTTPHHWLLTEFKRIQSEVRQKEKHQYSILTHIYGI